MVGAENNLKSKVRCAQAFLIAVGLGSVLAIGAMGKAAFDMQAGSDPGSATGEAELATFALLAAKYMNRKANETLAEIHNSNFGDGFESDPQDLTMLKNEAKASYYAGVLGAGGTLLLSGGNSVIMLLGGLACVVSAGGLINIPVQILELNHLLDRPDGYKIVAPNLTLAA